MERHRNLRLVNQRRIRRNYTDEELTLFWNLLKIEMIQLMRDEAHARRSGDQLTLPELLDGVWKHLRPGRQRQAAKEFKIYICEGIIKSVFFLPKDKNDGKSYVYVRR